MVSMGCGQSKMLVYHRKSKLDKHNHANSDSDGSDGDAESEEAGAHCSEQLELSRPRTLGPEPPSSPSPSPSPPPPTPPPPPTAASGTLLDAGHISTSQMDFFKMLDEKIENGPDYEEDDMEREQERERLRSLLHDWLRVQRPNRYLDTQRFPTSYQPCPPTPRVLIPPRPLHPINFGFTRHASVDDAYHLQALTSYAIPPPEYSRALFAKTAGRAMSFDMSPYQPVQQLPHGSPRPLAIRLPASEPATWRRPRGPVSELV